LLKREFSGEAEPVPRIQRFQSCLR
jgi:hypothetical protein